LCPAVFVAEDYLPLRLEDTKVHEGKIEKLFIIIGSRQERKERPRSKHVKRPDNLELVNLELKVNNPIGMISY
jgi:hypothetical protein